MTEKRPLLLIVLLFVVLISHIFPDIIIFRTGERKTGLIVESESDEDNIMFLSVSGEMKIPRSRISRITMEPKDQSYVHIARGYLEMRNYVSAKEHVEKALALNSENEEARSLLSIIQEEINRNLAKSKQEKAIQIDQTMEMVSRIIDSTDWRQYQGAYDALGKIKQSDLSPSQIADLQSLYFNLYYQWGLSSLDRLNPKAAAEYLEKALALQPDHPGAFDKLLTIWDSDPAMTTKVIDIYEKQYREKPEDIDLNRKLADLYYRQRDFKSAVPFLKKVHAKTKRLDAINAERLREALVHLHSDAAFNKRFDLAAQHYRELLDAFPGSDPTPLYYYQYSQMRQSVAEDDYEAIIRLGEFCKQRHLDEEAKSEFFYVLDRDPGNPQALQNLMEYAQRDLSEARLAFDKKDYDATLYIISQIVNQYMKLTDILTTAYELKERAEIEIRRENKEIAARAKALAARGNEYHATADMHINAMKSMDRRSEMLVVSDREEAKKFLQRAISTWEAALRIDPSLARRENEDLGTKISDARNRLINLTRVVPFSDVYRYRRPSSPSSGRTVAP